MSADDRARDAAAATIAANLAAIVAARITPLDAGTILAAAVASGAADGIDIAAAILAYAADNERGLTTWNSEYEQLGAAAAADDYSSHLGAYLHAGTITADERTAAAATVADCNCDICDYRGPSTLPRRAHSGAAVGCNCSVCIANRTGRV